ncbi:MAG: acylphosphatase [Bacteroidales bacterium]|nr:acylphosphatase [Bacteroidales bacterium]
MKTVQIIITGKVYKVGFLYFAKQMAEEFEIKGSVKYTLDYSINIEATGTENAMDKFISYCQLGCIGSQVKNISISETAFPQPHSFQIINENKKNSVINNININ